jgi:putative transcriptional regulator
VDKLAGKFLLASAALGDPNFARSVVLIIRHDAEGAFGLVINKPLSVSVREALGESIPAARSCEAPVYSGGPCQGPVFVLHADPSIGGEEPLASLYVTTDREAIEQLLHDAADPIKLFASYSGWGAGQLENELGESSWLVVDADADEVFSVDPHLWSRLSTRANLSKFVDPQRIPDDPSVN